MTTAFPTPANAPLLWERPVCRCYQFYQYYLCGCPDDGSSNHERGRCSPSMYRCDMWYAPDWIKRMAEKYGFRHDLNPPIDSKPHVLPFPCYRHLMESRVVLPPSALRATRERLLDPKWNPASAARMNRNRRRLQQQFVGEHQGWETRKRVREMDDEGESSQPRPIKRSKPEGEALAALRQRLVGLKVASLLAEEKRRRSGLSAQPRRSFSTQQEESDSPPELASDDPFNLNPEPTRNTRYFVRSRKKTVRFRLTDTSSSSDSSSSPPSSPPSPSPSPPTSSPSSTSSSPPPTPPPTPPTPSESDCESTRLPSTTPSPVAITTTTTTKSPPPSSSLWSYFTLPPPRKIAEQHFASLAWLAEEQAVDLWALDGYRWRCPPLPLPAPPTQQQQQYHQQQQQVQHSQPYLLSVEQQQQQHHRLLPLQQEQEKLQRLNKQQLQPRDVPHDGNTHRGYHHGAYMTDPEVLRQARVANWSVADPTGWWASEVGRWWLQEGGGGGGSGGVWGGRGGLHLSME